LNAFPDPLPEFAERALLRLGVRVRTATTVENMDATGVNLRSGGQSEFLPSRTVLWAAGVQASPLAALLEAPTDRSGRIAVRPTCQHPNRDEVFVIGDMAAFSTPAGKVLPGIAPVAMQQGAYVANAIQANAGKPDRPFAYVNKGDMATVGRAAAVADFGSFHLTGFVAWLIWLFVHILFLVGFRNRVLVFVHWAFQYFTFNRGARLIAAEGARPPSAVLRPDR